MKNVLLFRFIRNTGYFLCTHIARALPLWKSSPSVEVMPPILPLPVSLPINYNQLSNSFAAHFIESKIIPARRVFILKNVFVSGQGVVFKNLRIFLPSLTWLKDLNLYRQGKFLIKQWSVSTKHVPATEVVALVYDQWSAENYYHWIVESLPRLVLVQEKYPQCLVLIPEPAPEFIHTTLSLMGVTRLFPLHKHTGFVLKLYTLVIPELIYYYEEEEYASLIHSQLNKAVGNKDLLIEHLNAIDHREELIVAVRRKLLSHFNQQIIPKRKIFVSRSLQKTRRLTNENEILPILNKYDFEVILFENLTFNEQVRLMQETAIFLGVHGANMVNILFMHPGMKVIEMINKDHFNEAYYLLSSTFNLPYYSVPCSMVDPAVALSNDSVKINDADLLVNTFELENLLNMCISEILD